MTDRLPKTPRGRNRAVELLRCAIDVFIEYGYEGASLSRIIERSGGSRTVIYQVYGNKEGLFLAALGMMADDVYQAYVSNYHPGRSLREEFEAFGRIFLTGMFTERAVGACRLVFAQSFAFQGVDLEKDPIFQARMKAGLVAMSSQEQRDAPLPKGAKLSVVIFLLSVVFIVAMLLFKKEIGHTLGSRDIIVITMLFISMLMYWFCDVELTKIKNSSIFKGGYESLVVILGICWLASTVIGIYIPTIKEQATVLLGQYPGLLALAFFCVSALLFSQGATSALLVPVAASLGCDAPMILACFVAVSGIFVTNVYPTSAFAISCDDTGSFMGKWSGTYVINHPFFLPGCLGLVAAIPFGFLMAGLVF